MRATLRSTNAKQYWADRWARIPVDSAMSAVNVYPLKYAIAAVPAKDGRILEAGCGNGRVLRYFHERGYAITGIDFVREAVDKLRNCDENLQVQVADVKSLPFADATFRYVLAFGLYHSIEKGLPQAVRETWRVLTPGGSICASVRADNLQNRLTDALASREAHRHGRSGESAFHKWNLTKSEFVELLADAGFTVETVIPVENMPLVYRFRIFRAKGNKEFDEGRARVEGFRLSRLGQCIQASLMKLFPNQFCNLYLIYAYKP